MPNRICSDCRVVNGHSPRCSMRPRASWDEDKPWFPALQVFEGENAPIDTGLLNVDGTKLFRTPQLGKIGFDLSKGRR